MHPRGWLNDPNGIVRHDGRWHVFFQYNPHSARHHLIRWGHMSSPDLVRWTEEPLGPEPREGSADETGCWSGVAIVEDGVPHLVYSGVSGGTTDLSRVIVQRGDQQMRQFEPLPGLAADIPDESGLIGVRDPFLFELDGRRLAVQGAGLRRTDAEGRERLVAALLAWDRTDLSAWRYLGIMLLGDDPVAVEHVPADLWECPQVVRLGEGDDARWVVTLGKWRKGIDGPDELGGVAYLVGDLTWDAAAGCPRFTPETGGEADAGPDFYAPQACVDGDRVLLWGWSWEGAGRTDEQADEQGWAGVLTFPRELSLRDGVLVSTPPHELTALRGAELAVSGRAMVDGNAGDAAGEARIDLPSPARAEVRSTDGARVELVGANGQVLRVVAEQASGEVVVYLDASLVELLPAAAAPQTVRVHPEPGEHLRVVGPAAGIRAWELGVPAAH